MRGGHTSPGIPQSILERTTHVPVARWRCEYKLQGFKGEVPLLVRTYEGLSKGISLGDVVIDVGRYVVNVG